MPEKNKRTGISRRKYIYDSYLPERRSGKDRREDEMPLGYDDTSVEEIEPARKSDFDS